MEKKNGNICLIKERKFCIIEYGVSNELTNGSLTLKKR